MPRYTFKIRATAYLEVEIEDDNYEEAKSLALRQAERLDSCAWEIDSSYDIDDYSWEQVEGEEEAPECTTCSPDTNDMCSHHKDGMHIAREHDGTLLCDPWPIESEEESDEDVEVEADNSTLGCKAEINIRGYRYTCVHHRNGNHEATGSSPLVKWPIDTGIKGTCVIVDEFSTVKNTADEAKTLW